MKIKKYFCQSWHALIITTWFLIINLQYSQSCFVVHYVTYFKDMPMKYYLQMSQNSSFPYIVHMNQPLNLPNNRTFTREISPVEMSDIKKIQIIYHHGGLYLDNDQFIDYQCVKKHICNLTGLYFLDWTYIKQRWKNTVPLSFIYSSHAYNETLKKSLQGLNQSIQAGPKGPRTVYFSGPTHMQQYRQGMSFVKIPKRCQYHRADRSWVNGKPQNQLKYQNNLQRIFLSRYNDKQKQAKDRFIKLWQTQTVIYPKNFDIKIQSSMDQQFNHVQILDTIKVSIKVIKFSTNEKNKKLLQNFIKQADIVQNDDENTDKQIKLKLRSINNQVINVQKSKKIKKIKVVNQLNDNINN